MAAVFDSCTSSSVQASRRSKEGRSRPNLSKICMKTKMCSFYQRGMCKRGESCSFAHDPNEIQTKPDLCCTKLCPALVSSGSCSQAHCKFAHSEDELRTIDVDRVAVPSIETTLPKPSAPANVAEPELASSTVGFEQAGSFRQTMASQLPQTAPQVISRLSDAALSGNLTVAGMVFHLTRIFLAVYETRPEVARRTQVAADALAAATVDEVWAEAGLSRQSLMCFKEFARRCALPSELIPKEHALPEPFTSLRCTTLKAQLHSTKDDTRSDASTADSDTFSQCSSDEASRTTSGWLSSTQHEDVEDDWWHAEIQVMNTFIHVSTPRIATRTRRSRSVPSRSGRAV